METTFSNRIFFTQLPHEELFVSLSSLGIQKNLEDTQQQELAISLGKLADIAFTFGFSGNIWRFFLTLELASSINPFTTACEQHSNLGSMENLALEDIKTFQSLFSLSFSHFPSQFSEFLTQYKNGEPSSKFPKESTEKIALLTSKLENASSPDEFLLILKKFYQNEGTGEFPFYQAFRLDSENHTMLPIRQPQTSRFDELVGYENQKSELRKNTENFLEGKPANNVLLFGESGTGKSTCIKSILHEYAPRGLRMIELYKHQIRDLSALASSLRYSACHFIIYMDDLSFEEYEVEYKYLKAMIEGGLDTRPENVLIYATSNRRHLVREQWSDRRENENDIHSSDTMQEKLSLAARFGVSLYFPSPDPREFQNIVKTLAAENGIDLPEEELLKEARRWEMRHGGLSGRTARQFITYLQGK